MSITTELLKGLIQLLLLIFGIWVEKDTKKKANKKALRKELARAIKGGDLSEITAVTDKIRRSK
jgi:hypothetical protein